MLSDIIPHWAWCDERENCVTPISGTVPIVLSLDWKKLSLKNANSNRTKKILRLSRICHIKNKTLEHLTQHGRTSWADFAERRLSKYNEIHGYLRFRKSEFHSRAQINSQNF